MKPLFLLLLGLSSAPVFSADEPFPIPAKNKPAVAAYEAPERIRRRESRAVFNASIGPAFFSNLNVGGAGFLFAGAYGWDLGDAILKLNADLAFNSNAFWATVGPGVQGFFLVQGDIAPYAGLDFGITYSHAEDAARPPRTVTGFSVGAELGVVLFRTANVSFDGGLRYAWLLKENGYGLPQMFTIKVGMWF